MLEIRAPRIFAHAGSLPPQFAPPDPRDPDFPEDVVRIDLRDCDFVYPPAWFPGTLAAGGISAQGA